MNKYVIKFTHVEECEYTAVVEAGSYREAMDAFEKNPFAYAEKEEPDNRKTFDWNVSKVTREDEQVMYENSRKLSTLYS